MEERQTNYTVAEGYRLPSEGKIYNKAINPVVELRSMTARDEMKRQNPTVAPFKLLADLVEGCMIEKPAIHVYDMALGDYEYLLHKLRVVTYGDSYKVIIGCPHCGTNFEDVIHLDELAVKEFDEEKFNSLRTFTLPKSNKTVTIRFQTPRMLDEMEGKIKEMKRKYKDAEIAFDNLVLLSQVIESVDGEVISQLKIEDFINKLPAMDMAKILNNLEALNNCIGLEKGTVLECKECGGEVQTYFRLGPEFFRPTNI